LHHHGDKEQRGEAADDALSYDHGVRVTCDLRKSMLYTAAKKKFKAH
jgi:hypothetical protein